MTFKTYRLAASPAQTKAGSANGSGNFTSGADSPLTTRPTLCMLGLSSHLGLNNHYAASEHSGKTFHNNTFILFDQYLHHKNIFVQKGQ